MPVFEFTNYENLVFSICFFLFLIFFLTLVPEKLRVLLRETESDSTERVNLNFGEMPSSSENRDGKALNSNEKSARKARTIQRSIKQVI